MLRQLHADEISPAAYFTRAPGTVRASMSCTWARYGVASARFLNPMGVTIVVVVVVVVRAVAVLCRINTVSSAYTFFLQFFSICKQGAKSESKVADLVAGVVVVKTVVALGTRRYELQNEVAGPPKFFKIPNTPVTTLQLTARGAILAWAASEVQVSAGTEAAQLKRMGDSAAATDTSERRSVLSSMIVARKSVCSNGG
jgi:hypothetical protein